MRELTLVELIAAYERAFPGRHESEGAWAAYNSAQWQLVNRLMGEPNNAASHRGAIYVAHGGVVVIARDVRAADEIDREGTSDVVR